MTAETHFCSATSSKPGSAASAGQRVATAAPASILWARARLPVKLSPGARADVPDRVADLSTQPRDPRAHRRKAKPAPTDAVGNGLGSGACAQDVIATIAEVEKRAILGTIQQLNGDKLLAAQLLGIGRTTLYRKLKQYGAAGRRKPTDTC